MKHIRSFISKMSMMQIILWHGRNLNYKRSDLMYFWLNKQLYYWQVALITRWKRI